MFAPPVALLFSIVGICKDRPRTMAIAGLVLSLIACGLFLLPPLCV
ncbi:MAG: hypothetical protein ACYTGW_08875 [Planctomycetota bacterium]